MSQHYLQPLFNPTRAWYWHDAAHAPVISVSTTHASETVLASLTPAHAVEVDAQIIASIAKNGARVLFEHHTAFNALAPSADCLILQVQSALLHAALAAAYGLGLRHIIVLAPQHDADSSTICTNFVKQQRDCYVLGPTSSGVQRPHLAPAQQCLGVWAQAAQKGSVGLITQSSGMAHALLDWASSTQIGFSAVISLGAQSGVTVADCLDFLALDEHTESIVLVFEKMVDVRQLMSALRAAACVKPVVVLKTPAEGEHYQDAVLEAALARAGALRVQFVLQLLSSVKALAAAQRPKGNRLAVLANAPGTARLAWNWAKPAQVVPAILPHFLPTLLPAVTASLDAAPLALTHAKPSPPSTRFSKHLSTLLPQVSKLLPQAPLTPAHPAQTAWVQKQAMITLPLQAGLAAWQQILQAMLTAPECDGVLLVISPEPAADMALVVDLVKNVRSNKPIIPCLMGETHVQAVRAQLNVLGIPAYRSPEAAVDAFGKMARFANNQILLRQVPAPAALHNAHDIARARVLLRIAQINAQQQEHDASSHSTSSSSFLLARTPCAEILSCFGIRWAPSETGQENSAERFAPFSSSALDSVRMGVLRDPQFGAVIQLEGQRHRPAIELPPLNALLAERLIARARIVLPIEQHQSLMSLLQAVSEMVCELPAMLTLQLENLQFLNAAQAPVLLIGSAQFSTECLQTGLEPAAHKAQLVPDNPYAHMVIQPYPAQLEKSISLTHFASDDVSPPLTCLIRPIRPEDARALQNFVRGLSDHTRYMRFISAMRELSPSMLARFTQIDYLREMAMVASLPMLPPALEASSRIDSTPQTSDDASTGNERIIGVARYVLNPDGRSAEYALVISDAWQGQGLGTQLMRGVENAARSRGLQILEGFVLSVNQPMQKLMHKLGYAMQVDAQDATLLRVWKHL